MSISSHWGSSSTTIRTICANTHHSVRTLNCRAAARLPERAHVSGLEVAVDLEFGVQPQQAAGHCEDDPDDVQDPDTGDALFAARVVERCDIETGSGRAAGTRVLHRGGRETRGGCREWGGAHSHRSPRGMMIAYGNESNCGYAADGPVASGSCVRPAASTTAVPGGQCQPSTCGNDTGSAKCFGS